MSHISVSDYWNDFLKRVVDSGIRHSKAQVVSEALARHRRALDAEMEEALQVKAEIKERREARRQT